MKTIKVESCEYCPYLTGGRYGLLCGHRDVALDYWELQDGVHPQCELEDAPDDAG